MRRRERKGRDVLSPSEGAPLKVLLATTHRPLLLEIGPALERGGFLVRRASTVDEIYASAGHWDPHIFIPDLEAFHGDIMGEVLRFTRENSPGALIIVLTRRTDLSARLDALSNGADDILQIPMEPEELLARIRAMVRRVYRESRPLNPPIRIGGLEIDIANNVVRAHRRRLRLTHTEVRLLYLLASNASMTLSRDDILDSVWSGDFDADSNLVDRHISNLRTKLEVEGGLPRCIFTIRGQGYSFIPPDERRRRPHPMSSDTCG